MEALHVPEKFPPPWSNGVLGVESEVAHHSGRMRSTIELSKEEVELNSVPRISTVCDFILNNFGRSPGEPNQKIQFACSPYNRRGEKNAYVVEPL
jgi:hypothetical protein